jgi:hypothetical protein
MFSGGSGVNMPVCLIGFVLIFYQYVIKVTSFQSEYIAILKSVVCLLSSNQPSFSEQIRAQESQLSNWCYALR